MAAGAGHKQLVALTVEATGLQRLDESQALGMLLRSRKSPLCIESLDFSESVPVEARRTRIAACPALAKEAEWPSLRASRLAPG